jgi:hypothetical protein
MQHASHLAVVRPAEPIKKETLEEQAARLWPKNSAYQQQWIRSVRTLRSGDGTVLDGRPVDWHATDAIQTTPREMHRPYINGIDKIA